MWSSTTVHVFMFLFSWVTCREHDHCRIILNKLYKCNLASVLRENCVKHHKSNATLCVERLDKIATTCNSSQTRKIFENAVNMYRTSDRIVCEEKFRNDMWDNQECWEMTADIAKEFLQIWFPFLNVAGCRMMKLLSFHIMKFDHEYCLSSLMDYMEKMYEMSTCGKVTLEGALVGEMTDCNNVAKAGLQCIWDNTKSVPDCKREKQDLELCWDLLQVHSCTLLPIEQLQKSLLERLKKNVNSFCYNRTLHHVITANDCWLQIVTKNILWKGAIEILGTEEAKNNFDVWLGRHVLEKSDICNLIMQEADEDQTTAELRTRPRPSSCIRQNVQLFDVVAIFFLSVFGITVL